MKVAVIPARGGSKRIPNKNVKPFCGKPIIAYSIEAALASEVFDRVIVSTDFSEVMDVAKEYGAEVPFLRPDELSDDHTPTIPVIAHAIETLDQQVESDPDSEQAKGIVSHACCIYATAPFVQVADIESGLKTLQTSQADFCFTATSFAFPIWRAIGLSENNTVEMFWPENGNKRSQDLEEAYHDAGQFYWGTSHAWKNATNIFSANSTAVVIPRARVQDIDTVEDWERAEAMYQASCE